MKTLSKKALKEIKGSKRDALMDLWMEYSLVMDCTAFNGGNFTCTSR